MKDTKLLGKESSNEEEKTKFEKIEEEVKNAIFSVYYLLLKNQETTFWKFIIILVIEYLQLLSFSFDTSMIDKWKQADVVQYFAQFLSTFRIVYWLQKLSWDVYVIIFYICIFLVFVIIMDFLYVAISFKHKKFSFVQPIQILRIASMLVMTIFFIPITEFFFSLSACEQQDDGSGLRHVVFSEVTCFESIHVLHIVLSYVMLIIFGLMTLLSILMHYENRFTKDPTAKLNAKTDLFMILQKVAYVFIFTFFSQEEYCLFKSILLCIFSSITFLSYITNKPYFNRVTQIISEIFAGIFVWTNYVLLFTQIIQDTAFTGALEILFLGIPIVCILIYTRQEDRLQLLMTSETQIQKPDLCQKKNFFYIHIIETKEVDRYSAIILKGYINHHSEVCPFDTCPIKAFKKLLLREKMNLENDRKKKLMGGKLVAHASENNALLYAQAKALYNNGIKKFPKDAILRIDYANFLQSRMKDRKGALNELAQVEKMKPSLDHQFMVYRQRNIIQDELTEGQEHGGIDFIAALNFENQFKSFKQLIEKSAMLHYEFWNHLLDESPDLVRLSQQGAKINASILTVEDHWKKLSKMSTNTPKALKLYASYLIEILNDKETGNEQMIKAKEAANLRVNFEFNNVNEDYSDLNNYAQDGTPCIYISGEQEQDRLGHVNQCNMSLCKIFGYTKKEEILGRDVEMLMPTIYSDNHKEFLRISAQKSADQISSRERQVFGKHFSGFIFPIWLQIKNLPSLLSGRQYVATFKVEKTGINKNVCHILLNKNKEIMDITPSCMKMLGISYEKFNKKIVYYDIPSLFPQLFQASAQQFQNKAGSVINYYQTKIVDMNEFKKKNSQDFDDQNKNHSSRDNPDGNDDVSQMDRNSQDDAYAQEEDMTSPSPFQHKSSQSLKKKKDDDDEDENTNNMDGGIQNIMQFQYKAIGNEEKVTQLQCNLTEIYFELINLSYGYHLRLESLPEKQNAVSINKKVKQQVFQFSYDPLFKRFVRELRDGENKDLLLDKNFLELKHIKEKIKNDGTSQEDQALMKYQNMTYIAFLNKRQKIQERIMRGANPDEDDDDNPSEDDSNASDDSNNKSKLENDKKNSVHTPGATLGQANKLGATTNNPLTQTAQPINLLGGQNNIDYNKILVAGEGYGKEFLKSEIERLIKVLQDKQLAGQGVHTFIRLDGPRKGWEENNNQTAGLFSDRAAEMQKIEEEEEENDTKEKDSDKDNDQLKANIKSKKAFSMAINDKTMPASIKRLSYTAQIIILFLIALATAEYSILYQQFQDTQVNFLMIQKSYQRTAEIQKVVYNARTMILMNQGILTNYAGYSNQNDFVTAIKQDFQASLDLIYKIQNEINLSQLSISDEHDQLLNNKTVTLYFKEDARNMKPLQFSLTESILQISSTIFTISNMNIQTFNETNEDVFFLMYNSFNEFYEGLEKSSRLYVKELDDRSQQKSEIGLVLYILSIIALVICLLVLIPVVHSVNQQKDKVLSLFCEIDNGAIRVLALRCERFINNLQSEEGNDDVDSNEDIENNMIQDDDDEYNLLSGTGKRTKKPKGKTKTDKQFFLKFIFCLLCVHAYYLQNYLLQLDAVDTTQVLNKELNVTAITEPFYWFSLNTQREMFFNPNKTITNKNSLDVAKLSIYQLYDQSNDLQQMHLDNQNYLDVDYWDKFDEIMRNDLCPKQSYFTSYDQCKDFISGTLTQGLHVVIIRYFETLRNTLNYYQNFTQTRNQNGIRNLVNIKSMEELYVIQNFMTQKFMRELTQKLSDSIQSEFNFRVERKIALFIVFLIVILISFIIFWLPFLNGLNFQIYKTKLMLMIIPLEILMKIKNVAKVLQSQSFLTNNNKKRKNNEAQSQ